MKKAAVYFRCSTEKQMDSVPDQKRSLEKYAAQNDYMITHWFDGDTGKSGTSFDKRPDFMKMVRTVESRRADFQFVLVYDVDRWGRPVDPDEATYWEVHFRRHGVSVVYVNDPSVNDQSLGGRLTKKIKQELASEESRKQSLRVRERSNYRALDGYWVGGTAPYGYDRVIVDADGNKIQRLKPGERKYEKTQRVRLTPGDSEKVEVVRRMFSLRLKGMGLGSIAGLLNSEGVPSPRGGKWGAGTILGILGNPVYIGSIVYNRQAKGVWVRSENHTQGIVTRERNQWVVTEGAHKPIIEPRTFEAVQESMRNGQKFRSRKGSRYLLSGLIFCEKCGRPLYGHKRKNSMGTVYRYYDESGSRQYGLPACSSFAISQDLLEDFVIKHAVNSILRNIDKEKLRDSIKKHVDSWTTHRKSRAKQLRDELAEINKRIENLTDAIEKGVDPTHLNSRFEKLYARRLRLEDELQAERRSHTSHIDTNRIADEALNYLDRLESILRKSSFEELKNVLRILVSRISADPATRKVTCTFYKLPIPRQENNCVGFVMPEAGIEPAQS